VDPRIARRAAGAALALGILAEVVFDRVALGMNVPIATVLLIALVTVLAPNRRPADRLDLWLAALAIVASLGPALRTDPSVVQLDLVIMIAAIAAWSTALSGVAVTRRSAAAVAWLGVEAGVALGIGFAWLVSHAASDGALASGVRQVGRLAPVLRGVLIAVPVIAGFALLLGSADAVFGRAIDDALRFPVDLADVSNRALFAMIAAALVGGPLAIAVGGSRALLAPFAIGAPAPGDGVSDSGRPKGPRPHATEALVVLAAVDTLFAAFAAVQVAFLFGGASTLSAIGMTYSDYARQGYFQLVFVVGLAGLLLLGAHEVAGRTRRFLGLAVALLLLTGLILASAAVRLALYQGAYGWTELRFFVAASIAWLGTCLVLTLGALGANRMRWLPHAIAMSAAAVTLAVSALGPQAFVMHQNLARVLDPSQVAPDGHSGFDIDYATALGDDAVPDLVAALAVVPAADAALLRAQLVARRTELEFERSSDGPLSWNLSRERARSALATLDERQ
jgi:Domain of unknown function (DUF4173)